MAYFFLIMKSHADELFTVELTSMTTGQEVVSKPQGKAELRRQYLLEKYVWKWKQFMRSRKGEGLFPRLLKLSHNNWLRQVKKNIFKIVLWFPSITGSPLVVLNSVITIFCEKSNLMPVIITVIFFAGPLHTSHSGSQTGSVHHCGGPNHNP